MNHLVLLHGIGADSSNHWLPYLQTHFKNLNWQVDAPNLPNDNQPDLQIWLDFVCNKVSLTTETVLVGHSMGCPLILSLLERSSVKVAKTILVAGFSEAVDETARDFVQQNYDWSTIKNNCSEFYFVNSDNDPYGCDDKQGRLMLDKLGGTQVTISGGMHFGTEEFNDVCDEFPFLVKLIEG